MSIRLTILSHLQLVAKEQGTELPPLSEDLPLVDSGIDSVGFAILVAQLEDSLGFDPFSTDEPSYFPVTLGDFISIYEHAASREFF